MFFKKISATPNFVYPSCSLLLSTFCQAKQFVPKNDFQLDQNILPRLREFIEGSHHLFVITGAGISTESGIRDYRSEEVGLYAISNSRPVQHQDFLESAKRRQTYWARNYAGWPVFSSHKPNDGHYAVAELEKVRKIYWTVTQNVDSLHTKAGSKRLTELHGSSSRVICLACGITIPRDDLQRQLQELNPNWSAPPDISAPDGDVLLHDYQVQDFQIPDCSSCGGILKPDVVFFGDNVPRDRVNLVHEYLRESDAVLVLGSSLQVYSAYRFMVAAREQKKPLAIINIGPTRADDLATLKVPAKIGEIVDLLRSCSVQN